MRRTEPAGSDPTGSSALVLALVLVLLAGPAAAHEVRPGYVLLDEAPDGSIAVLWKQPAGPGADVVVGLGIAPVFPSTCERIDGAPAVFAAGAVIERFRLRCPGGLDGLTLRIDGLERTLTDVFVRARFADGTETHRLLRPESPRTIIARGAGIDVPAYLLMGIEHLIYGFDHVLFVLALMFLVNGVWRLVGVITAFTLAHSVTLGLATLEVVRLPQAAVEAAIALSILFVAVELVKPRHRRSRVANERPALIAFSFGLLHGFGFAGVLLAIGLPRDAALPALFLFNLGVEIGQLMVVAGFAGLAWLLARLPVAPPRFAATLPIWFIGVISAYWLTERVVGFA